MKLRKILLYVSLIFGGVAFVSQKLEKKKRIRWHRVFIGVILGVTLIVGLSVNQVFSKAGSTFSQSIDGCAVVFGAAVWRDSQPSWALDDRIQAALNLYQADQINCLILSGGASTFGDHETDVMARIAREAGIPARDITLDYDGYNTLATIIHLDKNAQPYVFVSNDFHLARIGLMAERQDIQEFYLHAAPYQKGRYTRNDDYFLREMAGYLLILFGLW